jgi:hypothetical protein
MKDRDELVPGPSWQTEKLLTELDLFLQHRLCPTDHRIAMDLLVQKYLWPRGVKQNTIPIFLQSQLGIQLKGDQWLYILGENAPVPVELLSVAAITTAGTNAGFSGPQMGPRHELVGSEETRCLISFSSRSPAALQAERGARGARA